MAAINPEEGKPLTAIVWDELPDPRDPHAPRGARTQIRFERRCWQHILEKHVLPGREPWADIFSDELLRRLVRLEDTGTLSDPVVADTIQRLGQQVREALQRPLVLLYEVRRLGDAGRAPPDRWLLVLPAGAVAFVHQSKGRNRLATCYFPAYASVIKDRGFRWRHLVSHLVWQYGVVETRCNALVLPTEDTVKPAPSKGPVKELRSAIRFVTPTTWGFCPELAGCPWRGRLGPWPAAEAPSAGSRRRLKPRRPRPPEQEENSTL